MTVDNDTKGYEKKNMFAITLRDGHKILVTEGHPMVTSRGIVAARHLKTGDVLKTETGMSPITGLQQQVFQHDVWNLDMGRSTDAVARTDANTTFIANGIVVGDGHIQKRFDRADFESQEQILRRLGKNWRTDYQNGQAMAKQQAAAQ